MINADGILEVSSDIEKSTYMIKIAFKYKIATKFFEVFQLLTWN